MRKKIMELVCESNNAMPEPVVVVQKACKYYGSKKNSVNVLENLNMTVPKGVIYGLLGPSGCGKTTLLNCILGQKQLDGGHIWILGGAPNSKESKVPGPHVGFMPQAPGIQDEYTTKETMQYFGGLAGMTPEKIEERMYFLQKLLMLPNLTEPLRNLSGGEKRRVSFAVALIHEPELLILDEPTVGLDPLLRESIWNYLFEITASHRTTVILTTHYIEETRSANMVGLLREGRILVEDSPDNLLLRFESQTLEDVFYNLSNNSDKMNSEISNGFNIPYKTTCEEKSKKNGKMSNIVKPLVIKNFQWLLKNPMIVIMAAIAPILLILMFAISIGGDPMNLNLAVVNDETLTEDCLSATCNSTYLSCNFLYYLKPKFILNYYDKEEDAIESVMYGRSYASIYFRHNYSAAIKKRIDNFRATDEIDLLYSKINVFRDVSQYSLASFLKSELVKSYQSFTQDYLTSCGVTNEKIMSLPIQWKKPVNGKTLPNYSQFVTPGLVISALTYLTAWSTASSLIMEYNNGVTERSLILGVNPLHVLFAHGLSEFFVLIVMLTSISICTFAVADVQLNVSMYLIIVLYGLMGIFGMFYGFALSSCCYNDSLITLIIVGSMFPSSLLTGMLWPVEGMPLLLQKFALIFPFAGMTDSVRSVTHRGWTITHPFIYTSVIIVVAWNLAFLIISVYFLKFKKR